MRRGRAVAAAVLSLLTAISVPLRTVADSSNANGTNTTVNTAAYAFYRRYEYGYRVTVYAGRDIKDYPSAGEALDNLLSVKRLSEDGDFFKIGQADLVNAAMSWHISDNTYVGMKNKQDYRSDVGSFAPVRAGDGLPGGGSYCFWVWNLPVFRGEDSVNSYYRGSGTSRFSPDYVALYGTEDEEIPVDSLTPEEYFLSRTVLSALLCQMSFEKTGNADWWRSLFAGEHPVVFRKGERTLVCGSDIGRGEVDPSSESCSVAYAVTYEPLVLCYLRGSADSVLFTATEFALSQGSVWNWFYTASNTRPDGIWPANGNHSFRAGGAVYNYDPVCLYTAGKQAQAVQSLVFGSLPSSVYLDRSWFGHPAFSSTVTDEEGSRIVSGDGRWWSVQAIVEYGGWGMEFFSPLSAAEEPSPEIDLAISPVLPNADYVSGLGTVISFAVSNNSSVKDITPDDGTYVRIIVSDSDGETLFSLQRRLNALPAGASTRVWTPYTVPEGTAGDRLFISGELLFSGGGSDLTPQDNSCSFDVNVAQPPDNTVPGEGFSPAPGSAGGILGGYSGTARWTEWEWSEGEGFVRCDYEAGISVSAEGTPSPAAHAEYDRLRDCWTVKSGYGFSVGADSEVLLTVSRDGGAPQECGESEERMTPVQCAEALFPEKDFVYGKGRSETLVRVSESGGASRFVFRKNPEADGERIHYIPVNYPDGDRNYSAAVLFSQCWTPAGMISAACPMPPFTVSGSLFDDWYAGR